MADCSVVQSEEKVSRSQEAVMLMPEYLVVCCWRSVKEISLILGQLTNDVAVSDDKHSVDGLLTHQQVLESRIFCVLHSCHSWPQGFSQMCIRLVITRS